MRISFLAAGLFLMFAFVLPYSLHAASTDISGAYSGSISGTPAQLTIAQNGENLTGKIDAQGYIYNLSGESSTAGTASGTLSDPQTNGNMEFEASITGSTLTLTMIVVNGFTGQTQRMPIVFQKINANQSGAQQSGSAQGSMQSNENSPSGAIDPRLVGTWSHSQSMVSGDASMVVQDVITLQQDGTFLMGPGRAVGGGAGYGFDSGNEGSGGGGKWRAQNKILSFMDAGTNYWQPYGRYYIEGGKCLVYLQDGSRQIWYRR